MSVSYHLHNVKKLAAEPFFLSLIPVAIVGATRFYATLVNVLSMFPQFKWVSVSNPPRLYPSGVIGYWSTAFAGIVLTEHFIFRKN